MIFPPSSYLMEFIFSLNFSELICYFLLAYLYLISSSSSALTRETLEMGLALTLKSHENNQKEIFSPGGDE